MAGGLIIKQNSSIFTKIILGTHQSNSRLESLEGVCRNADVIFYQKENSAEQVYTVLVSMYKIPENKSEQ